MPAWRTIGWLGVAAMAMVACGERGTTVDLGAPATTVDLGAAQATTTSSSFFSPRGCPSSPSAGALARSVLIHCPPLSTVRRVWASVG